MNVNRKYYADGQEISLDEWNKLLNDSENLKELTVKSEKILTYDELLDEVKSLREENELLKHEIDIHKKFDEIFKHDSPWTTPSNPEPNPWTSPWKYPYYPTIISYNDPDWTVRPENLPTYITTLTSQSDCDLR